MGAAGGLLDGRPRAPAGGLPDGTDRQGPLRAGPRAARVRDPAPVRAPPGTGVGPAQPASGHDELDDYHDWLLAHGYPDWRFDDRRTGGQRRGPAHVFPYGPDVHPTGWVEREATEFLERSRPESPAVPRGLVPPSARAVQPAGAVRVDVRSRPTPGCRTTGSRSTPACRWCASWR